MPMFEGFESLEVQATGARIAVRRKGSGPGLLLLHGYPQTHAMWHLLAPRLAQRYTVVCPDLRGYGASAKPPTDAEHAPYSKRYDVPAIWRAWSEHAVEGQAIDCGHFLPEEAPEPTLQALQGFLGRNFPGDE